MAGKASVSNPKKIIANLRKLTHIYKLNKKRNEIYKNWEGRGFKGCLDFFQKKHKFWGTRAPQGADDRDNASEVLQVNVYE